MIFHENRLLADNSHEISYLFFFKLGKMAQNLSSAAVVMDTLKVKTQTCSMKKLQLLRILVGYMYDIMYRQYRLFKSSSHSGFVYFLLKLPFCQFVLKSCTSW